jgi:hypothetical protein
MINQDKNNIQIDGSANEKSGENRSGESENNQLETKKSDEK